MQSLTLLGDRYRLGPIIGTGGMGAVHRAYDERFGREVAVKVVRSGADEVERERMRREAQYLAGLDHPNLVAVYDAGWEDTRTGETVWFAMELIEGPDLRHVLRDGGPLPTADVARVLEAAAGALGVLHDAGVVHRDLKPANVLLTAHPSSGRWDVKLADLGIAQLTRAEQLTSTGQVIGTAAYLSPEQVSGDRVGPASDVYALGLLVIEALTGRIAFPGGPVESAAARLVRAPDVPRGLDAGWRALLVDMTAREARDRPSIGEILRRTAALQRSTEPCAAPGTTAVPTPAAAASADEDTATRAMAVLDTQVLERPVRAPHETGWTPSLRRPRPRRRRRALLSAAALAVAVALAGGGAAVIGGSTADPVSAKTAVHDAKPSASAPASPQASASPAPERTKTAETAAEVVEDVEAEPAEDVEAGPSEDTASPADSARAAIRERATERLRRLQDRIEERLRERLSRD